MQLLASRGAAQRATALGTRSRFAFMDTRLLSPGRVTGKRQQLTMLQGTFVSVQLLVYLGQRIWIGFLFSLTSCHRNQKSCQLLLRLHPSGPSCSPTGLMPGSPLNLRNDSWTLTLPLGDNCLSALELLKLLATDVYNVFFDLLDFAVGKSLSASYLLCVAGIEPPARHSMPEAWGDYTDGELVLSEI